MVPRFPNVRPAKKRIQILEAVGPSFGIGSQHMAAELISVRVFSRSISKHLMRDLSLGDAVMPSTMKALEYHLDRL